MNTIREPHNVRSRQRDRGFKRNDQREDRADSRQRYAHRVSRARLQQPTNGDGGDFPSDSSSDSESNDNDFRCKRYSQPRLRAHSQTKHVDPPIRTKQKDPKPFDGSKTEWSDYLKHFEAVSDWNGWTESQKAKQLVMSFEGEALKLLGELGSDVLNDYEYLVTELNRRYDPAEQAQAWKIEFRNRSRKPSETVTQYAQSLKRLVLKAFPNMSRDAQEQWVLDQFTLGLGSVDLRRHVQFGHPHDLNAAISLAIEFEAFESGNRDKLRKPANRSAEVCAVGAHRPSSPETQNHSSTPNNKVQKSSSATTNSGDKPSSFDKSQVECHYCKKKGHFKKECRKLKYKLEQEAKKNGTDSSDKTNDSGN